MEAPNLGEAALELPWISPCAASLAALARGPSRRAWWAVRADPGAVLLLVRHGIEPATFASLDLSPVLETALQNLTLPGFVDWRQPGPRNVYHTCVKQACLARELATLLDGCDPGRAWVAGLLAPLGWLAACAAGPEQVAQCLERAAPREKCSTLASRTDGHARSEWTTMAGWQEEHWGANQGALTRRLSRRWQLPEWLDSIVGHLGLPVGIAQTLGAEPVLFQVVQLALGLTQKRGGLGVAVGAEPDDIVAALNLCPEQVASLYDKSENVSDVAITSWSPPAKAELLPELMHIAVSAQRRADPLQSRRLQAEVDHLQRALEEQCATENHRLEVKKLRALAELAAGAGHEINNPLAVISGQAQYLLSREPDQDRRAALQKIIGQAQRIHQILVDLMQFARPAAPQRQAVDAAALVRRAQEAFGAMAAAKDVRLSCPEPPTPTEVFADPAQIQHVLSCLVRNAVEAAPPQGWARLRVQEAAEQVAFIVEDSGPGPSPAVRQHMFDPFFSGRSAGRGRGLGLATAWRLARQNQGDVRFADSLTDVTRFVLTLPRAQQPAALQHSGLAIVA